jgi:uncharacterized repeat protein (TIGR01451 family)
MKKSILFLPLLSSVLFVSAQFGSPKEITKNIASPRDVVAADLNNDGLVDVVVASANDYKISWHENLGNGNFGSQNIISTNVSGANSIFAIDIDNDGDSDIVSSAINDNKISLHENLGGGSFAPDQIISVDVDQPTNVFCSDIDGDGLIDILSSSTSKTAWYKNLGNGNFGGQILISSILGPHCIFAVDLDNDGDDDVINSVAYLTNKIFWHENLGGGNFSAEKIISNLVNGPNSVYSTDLDNDGFMDVLSTSLYDDKVAWYKNLGNGSFGTQQIIFSLGGDPVSIFTTDINNDGREDVFVASQSDDKVSWYENLGNGNFGGQQVITSNAKSVRSVTGADLDSDGDIDILSVSHLDHKLAWYENLGGGVFNNQVVIVDVTSRPLSVSGADIDNDGNIDVLSASNGGNAVTWHRNLGNGVFTSKIVISTNTEEATCITSSDLDKDGDVDILLASNDDNKIVWYENIGNGNFDTTANVISNNAIGPNSVFTTDLDNDGHIDILFSSYWDNKIAWHKNLGNGIFDTTAIILSTTAIGAHSVFASDLDSDGDIDVLSASMVDDKVAWYKNLGNGIFDTTANIISSTANGAISVFASDLDNDGDIDVLSAANLDNKIAWYENLGNGIFGGQQAISTTTDGANSVFASDLDSDGDIDVLSSSFNDDKIAWYENLGNGNFGSQQIITNKANGSSSIFTSDLDNDGDLDILSASQNANKIEWHENYLYHKTKVSGKIYYDVNQNGINDSTDFGLGQIQIFSTPQSDYVYTFSDGDYFLNYTDTPGTYVIQPQFLNNWSIISDSLSYTFNIDSTFQSLDSLDFGLYPDTLVTILHSELTGGFPRCNTITNYWININNEGTTIPSGVIQLQLDDSISYVSSVIAPDSIIGQGLFWHYDSLRFFSQKYLIIKVQMPPFTSIGDTLTSTLIVTALDSLGNIVYSSADTLNQDLLCAHDPNDKNVLPKGSGLEGFISNNQPLEYLIRFQNTGNDTALTVIIKDTLDANLDWSSLKPIASSHDMQVSIEQGGEALFKFENIMLPDSNVDFLASQGFVKFSINQKSNLLPHTQIRNTGNIYFDYNPAVITNTVLNTIQCYGTPEPIINYNIPYLEVSNVGNYSYQWHYNDTLLVGATYDTLLPFLNGIYTVEISDSNACNNISAPYNFFSVHVNELSQLKTIVFPNPFSESTTILFDKNLSGEFDIHVVDIVGREVMLFQRFSGNKAEIHSKEIGKGLFLVYLTDIKTGERVFLERLIVK